MLGWRLDSMRTFTSNKKLTSVDDFKGHKFRMPGNPIHLGIAKNLGASAQVIPLTELFPALETGVVDGQDNGMVTVLNPAF
jgi:TRAP-type C4-dicarboxylate transport system substrate-binding protein